MNSRFEWIDPPKNLQRNILRYGDRVIVAALSIAAYYGQKMQNEARQNAPWEDRTGAARSGLFYAVDMGRVTIIGQLGPRGNEAMAQRSDVMVAHTQEGIIQIFLAHTVFYGKFLELSNGGRYAVIMSTIRGNLPQLERDLKKVLQ